MLQVARDLFKVSLYLLFRGAPLSRWPVDNSPYSMTLVGDGLPSWRHVLPSKAVF